MCVDVEHSGSHCCNSFGDHTYWELCKFLKRAGEPAVLLPETMAKFRLAMDAMEVAHLEGNNWKLNLLASIHNVVLLAHKLGKNKSLLEASLLCGRCLTGYL